jgi:integrase
MARKPKQPTSIAGFGSIFQRVYRSASGEKRQTDTWTIEHKVHGQAKPVRESGFPSAEAAFAELAKRHAAYSASDLRGQTASTVTFAKLFELLKQDYRVNRKKSLGIMAQLVDKWLVPAFGSMRVAELRKADIQSYITRRTENGDAPASINRTLSYMRRAMQLGADEEPPLVHHIQKTWFRKLPEANERTGVISEEQYQCLKSSLPDHAALALCIGYHTGMRRGLILDLRWEWVDLKASVIRIPPAENDTKKRPRSVPVYGDMIPMLEMARDHAKTAYVIEYDGRRIHAIKRSWKTAAKVCGCPESHFHDLRRTAATNALLAGVSETDILAMCGWKTTAMLRRYAQGMDTRAKATGDKMAAFMDAQRVEVKGRKEREM